MMGVRNGQGAAVLDGVKEGQPVIFPPEMTKAGKEVRAEVMTAAFVEG